MEQPLKFSERHRQRTSRGHERAALLSQRDLSVPEFQAIHEWLRNIEKGAAQALEIDDRPLNTEEARYLRALAQGLRDAITGTETAPYWVGNGERPGRALVSFMCKTPAALNTAINKELRFDSGLCDPKVVDTVGRFVKKELAQLVAEPQLSR